jgi:hypothetical protein
VRVVLTDLFPNRDRFRELARGDVEHVSFEDTEVDARAVPASLDGFRVMFNGFHHFAPADARAVLADAVAHSRGIAIFEMNGRMPPSLISVLFSPLTLLLVTPLLRPFRLSRLLWTYLIPVLPLAVLWDGIVSCLRVYDPEELDALVREVSGAERYSWRSGRLPIPGTPGKATYLIGAPAAR